MRKRSALLLAGLLLLTLGGCKKKQKQEPAKPQQTSAAASESAAPDTSTGTAPVLTEPAFSEITEQPPAVSLTTARTLPPESAADPVTTAAYDAGALTDAGTVTTEGTIDRDGVYTSKEDVALYLYTYGELPSNFITKKEAQKLGWSGGSLEPYAPGCCIGGSYFGNYEGNLPEKPGREYHECDIDTLGKKSRGAKRIVYSNDGLIYYTEDHYNTFELLYGEE
ncbi:MAG: ribonuclease [Oscillospiraceae bacterium]|nr:ribonuclease [Oscillospiraceae bacterium]